ncbi:MAG: Glyoxalase-like domain protein [Pelotomaculum sp. PtaB.Bin104]|nr:MAG: Glyoxalase-like domain protein [Pelotomaculum sp. PtaB.Bin104]
MPRVIHFELNADQPERAVQFYRDVFNWQITKTDGPEDYWLIDTGEEQQGINGAITKRMNPEATTVNTINVADLEASMGKIRQAGGKVLTEKMVIPGVGSFAYCQDTEGNTFGIIQEI